MVFWFEIKINKFYDYIFQILSFTCFLLYLSLFLNLLWFCITLKQNILHVLRSSLNEWKTIFV